jgi:hypothetical protein
VLLDGEPFLDLPLMLQYVKSAKGRGGQGRGDRARGSSSTSAQGTCPADSHSKTSAGTSSSDACTGANEYDQMGYETLDQEDLPTRAALNRISNRRVREVSTIGKRSLYACRCIM